MSELTRLLPCAGDAAATWAQLDAMAACDNLPPFGPLQLEFAAALSRALTGTPAARAHAELVALGFWLRPAHLKRLIDAVPGAHPDPGTVDTTLVRRLPRGLALHIAPGNVDTIFVYSWLISLLCGNRNVVRLSSRASVQTGVLIDVLTTLLAEPRWAAIAERVAVLRYGHDDRITGELSARCDLRVIWGGDEAVRSVRALPLPPHATEQCFPDKYSLALLQADAVAGADDDTMQRLARNFGNDAYTFGQMACSSPRLVLWLGDARATAAAQARFWPAVAGVARQLAHGLGPAEAVSKEVAASLLAMDADVHFDVGPTLVKRVWLDQPALHADTHCGGGLFLESRLTDLDGLLPLLSRRVQTVSHHGIDRTELLGFIDRCRPRGIDRWVPVGQALAFAPSWDGLNLWNAFMREVSIQF